MKKELITITILVLLYGGIFTLNSQLAIAKDSSSEDKKDSTDSNNDNTTTQTDEQNQLSNGHKSAGDSTKVPTVRNVVIPLQETVVQQQNTVTPQVTQAVHTGYLENSLSTISTQDNDINDTT